MQKKNEKIPGGGHDNIDWKSRGSTFKKLISSTFFLFCLEEPIDNSSLELKNDILGKYSQKEILKVIS